MTLEDFHFYNLHDCCLHQICYMSSAIWFPSPIPHKPFKQCCEVDWEQPQGAGVASLAKVAYTHTFHIRFQHVLRPFCLFSLDSRCLNLCSPLAMEYSTSGVVVVRATNLSDHCNPLHSNYLPELCSWYLYLFCCSKDRSESIWLNSYSCIPEGPLDPLGACDGSRSFALSGSVALRCSQEALAPTGRT